MRSTRSCAPARPTPSTARCSTSAATSRSSHRDLVALLVDLAGRGRCRFVEWPRREEGHRHRQLLRRLDAASGPRTGWTPRVGLRDGLARDARLLPRALRPTTSTRPARERLRRPRAVQRAEARRRRADGRRGDRPRHRLAAGSCSVPKSRPSKRSSPPRCGAATRGRRRHRHRRHRPDAARRSASARATRSSPRRSRPPTRRWPSMMAGATPVFADIDPARLTLDPAAAAAAVTTRTRAILPVHLYGQPADIDAIHAVARAARAGGRRRRLPGAPGHRRGAPGRQRSARRGLQLLSDQEPRRARRRRRRHHRRCRRWPSASSGCATAARPTATITTSAA